MTDLSRKTEPKLESIKEIADYLNLKYKTSLLWTNFTREKRNDEWYKKNTPTTSPFVNENGEELEMTDEQLLNSLQGTMATIDPYSVKKEAIDEYLIDTIEERLTRIEDKVDLLITQLKIEFYKKNDGTSR
jgi:hypothetical protein